MRLRQFLNKTEQIVEDKLFGGGRARAAEQRLHEADMQAEELLEDATKTLIDVKTKRKPNGTA